MTLAMTMAMTMALAMAMAMAMSWPCHGHGLGAHEIKLFLIDASEAPNVPSQAAAHLGPAGIDQKMNVFLSIDQQMIPARGPQTKFSYSFC